MKNYTITVNGNVYDVTVEEGTGSTAGAAGRICAGGRRLRMSAKPPRVTRLRGTSVFSARGPHSQGR